MLVLGLSVQNIVDSHLTPVVTVETLIVQATLLLAHVMPTFWLGHKAFDKENERWQAQVYTHAGPVGFGIVIGSFLTAFQTAHLPGGLTASSVLMLVIALIVAQAYWSNRVMSTAFDFETLGRVVTDPDILYILYALRDLQFHYRMRQGGNAIVRRNIHTLPLDWEEETRVRLRNENCSECDVKRGLEKITALRVEYAQGAARP